MMLAWMLAAGLLLSEPGAVVTEPEAPKQAGTLRELLPGVRVGEGVVEFGGEVCADLSHPQTPVVYLELLVTGPDSREHESLVVTRVKASAIHAGLLAAGLEPGAPVRWEGDRVGEAARGPRVRVEVATVEDGTVGEFVDLASWAVHKESQKRLPDADGWGLVFAGSRMDDRDGYAADETGTIIGLTGFGTEVVAAAWGLSPEAAVDEPVWIVDKERVPKVGTPVVVRVIAADKPEKKDEETPDPT
jgi:hypothetical protein